MRKKKHTHTRKPKRMQVTDTSTAIAQSQPTFNDVMRVVREKSQWLTTANKEELCRRHGFGRSGLRAQLNGTVKKPSYDLLSDALDMIRINEKKLLTRITPNL